MKDVDKEEDKEYEEEDLLSVDFEGEYMEERKDGDEEENEEDEDRE